MGWSSGSGGRVARVVVVVVVDMVKVRVEVRVGFGRRVAKRRGLAPLTCHTPCRATRRTIGNATQLHDSTEGENGCNPACVLLSFVRLCLAHMHIPACPNSRPATETISQKRQSQSTIT